MRLVIILLLFYTVSLFAQNEILTYEKTGKKILVGVCNENDFTSNPLFSKWFNTGYNNYRPQFFNYKFDKEKLKNHKIKIVLGTWCPDSRREFPRFMKILDSLNFPKSNLTIICVDRNKHSLHGEAEGLRIVYVPTFIFYNAEGKEIGRITEHPKGDSLEDDLERIILADKPIEYNLKEKKDNK